MGQCVKCGQETEKEDHDYCRKCFYELKKGGLTSAIDEAPIQGGLSERELVYRQNMIKARIAETLVEELFLSLGWNVFRYGMENTIPGVMNLLQGVRSDVADNIRRMPDFVVQDKNRNVFFIEVKFRASEEFNLKNLGEDYPYDNAYIVLVSKKHIKCITVAELRAGEEITPNTRNYLGYRKEFGLDKDAIISFCAFANKFFENVE